MQLELGKSELCCLQTADHVPSALVPWPAHHVLQRCPQRQLTQQGPGQGQGQGQQTQQVQVQLCHA